MSVALWLLHKKCSDTVVGLELLVCLFVEAVFKSTSGFSYVLFVTMVTLYHVDIAFGVAINVMINFADRIKRIQVSPSLWQQLLLFIKGLVSGTHILARKRKKKWNHFSTERCNCRKMWRSRPRFNFTENGGGFDAGTARWNMFIQFDIFWVESKRITFTLGKGERNMCTEATVVTVVPETWRRYGHQKVVVKLKTCWQKSERYFETTLEWNLIHFLVQSYNLGSWRHVSLISGVALHLHRTDISLF